MRSPADPILRLVGRRLTPSTSPPFLKLISKVPNSSTSANASSSIGCQISSAHSTTSSPPTRTMSDKWITRSTPSALSPTRWNAQLASRHGRERKSWPGAAATPLHGPRPAARKRPRSISIARKTVIVRQPRRVAASSSIRVNGSAATASVKASVTPSLPERSVASGRPAGSRKTSPRTRRRGRAATTPPRRSSSRRPHGADPPAVGVVDQPAARQPAAANDAQERFVFIFMDFQHDAGQPAFPEAGGPRPREARRRRWTHRRRLAATARREREPATLGVPAWRRPGRSGGSGRFFARQRICFAGRRKLLFSTGTVIGGFSSQANGTWKCSSAT